MSCVVQSVPNVHLGRRTYGGRYPTRCCTCFSWLRALFSVDQGIRTISFAPNVQPGEFNQPSQMDYYTKCPSFLFSNFFQMSQLHSAQGCRPLDLRHASNWALQSPTKKHRKHASITRSLKSLIESPQSTTPHHRSDSHPSHPNKLAPPSADTGYARTPPVKQDSWELIDDLPLRWATDFVPLGSAGSRLVHTSVLFFDLWPEDGTLSRGGTTLAVAAKSNIFLYETLKGERAFRFVKVSTHHVRFVESVSLSIQYL
jgi:hypothetical protein